ncbi:MULTISPECIES: HU family DNA-binding protein [Bacteroides]|jgi:predicted histone-like DNA-binding protein|uniref:HU family DNA-binding protein n=1 Tax=Bacteroides TaxID=816 RepID=UPI0005CC7AFD|nr:MULTISPECIES: HU family DNA-binding protein [Bacteroides]
MAIPFKRMGRKDPRKDDGVVKFHPQLVTQGQSVDLDKLAYIMKDKSSLSLGDIQSVLTNFVEAMRSELFDGKSVNIRDFGVFSLSATTLGADTKDKCTMKNIKTVNINFRPSSSVRPNLTSTRAGEKIEFLDLDAPKTKNEGGGTPDEGGNEKPGGGGDDGETPDPAA